MNILFDVSRFGTAWIDGTQRDIRGIYRVVWELASALSRRNDDVHLHLSSLSHPKIWGAARLAALRTPFASLPFEPVFRSAGLAYPYAYLARAKKFADHVQAKLKTYLPRADRKSSSSSAAALPETVSPPLRVDETRLDKMDVVHLPFFIMPDVSEFPRPIVITIHDLIPLVMPGDAASPLAAFLRTKVAELGPSHWIHCISEATKRDLLALAPHVDPDRVFVVPHGVSPFFTRVDDHEIIEHVLGGYGLEPGDPFVVSLSTVQPRKNLETALRAFSRVAPEFPRLKYVIAGYQHRASVEAIRRIAAETRVADRIVLTGFISDEEVRALYSAADAFLFPSLYEGFGLPPLEAMACGLPVICSNSSSLPEVVGNAGILVDPMDIDGFATAIRRLQTDGSLRSELSQKGLERSRTFTWERSADSLVRQYRKIAGIAP